MSTEGTEPFEEAVRAAVEAAGEAVVGLGRGWGSGSGVVVAGDLVVTNAHNVAGTIGDRVANRGAGEGGGRGAVDVVLAGGEVVPAAVAGVDVDGELAVLRLEAPGPTPVPWDPDDVSPRLGQAVVALANPGGRGLRAGVGFVAGVEGAFRGPRGRRIAGTVEHTAPLPRGSSGGPLLDARGRLVGINTNRLGEGFYAALPAGPSLARRVEALGEGRAPRTRRLGVAVVPARAARALRRSVGLPDHDGVLVRAMEEGGPAARAGLRQGDLLTAAGDRALAGVDDLHAVLDGAGDEGLAITVLRGTEELVVEVAW